MRPGAPKVARNPAPTLYFAPRAGMAELVDAADSKSVALKRRVGSIPSPGTILLMNFCSNCGSRVVLKVPEGDFLPRHVCAELRDDPLPEPQGRGRQCARYFEGRILICKRGIEPRHGYWTIPAGFMENDETLEAGAAREAVEEAQHRGRDRQPAAAGQCHQRPPGARVLPLTHADAPLRHHARKPRSAAGRRERDPVGPAGVPQHRVRAAPFRRGPCRGRGPAPRRRNARAGSADRAK